jgi:glutathionylspermidine synthase
MQRLHITPRPNAAARLEERGLSFHAWDGYWRENVCYEFTSSQIDYLEGVTNELHYMCCQAAKAIAADDDLLRKLQIPELYWGAVRSSLKKPDFHLYGRFDLAWTGVGDAKMLEYNADTPTSLLESAVSQWDWLMDVSPEKDQFNSIHEKLLDRWTCIKSNHGVTLVHFARLADNEEDWVCTQYLQDTALQAGLDTCMLTMDQLGLDKTTGMFYDMQEEPIQNLFKLYPWEWMLREDFGPAIIRTGTRFIEPLWKCLLSNKGILPVLWQMYPGHANLLPAYFEPNHLMDYAKKPIFSREGANITLMRQGAILAQDSGPYGSEGFVYQKLVELPCFEDRYPIIGSWVIGDSAAGICIREDTKMITTNMSNFVPHRFA